MTSENTVSRIKSIALALMLLTSVFAVAPTAVSADNHTADVTADNADHVVAADGSGDYSNIQTAVDNATSGDTIYVLPGDYDADGGLEITTANVTLVGAGADDVTINVTGQYPQAALLVNADGTHVEGLSFDNVPGTMVRFDTAEFTNVSIVEMDLSPDATNPVAAGVDATFTSDATFDMTNNWWGTTNETAIGDKIRSSVEADVQYSPYYESYEELVDVGTLEAVATDEDGNAVGNASISVLDSNGNEVASGETDTDGVFITELETGTYDVETSHPDYEDATATADITAGTTTTVEPTLTASTTDDSSSDGNYTTETHVRDENKTVEQIYVETNSTGNVTFDVIAFDDSGNQSNFIDIQNVEVTEKGGELVTVNVSDEHGEYAEYDVIIHDDDTDTNITGTGLIYDTAGGGGSGGETADGTVSQEVVIVGSVLVVAGLAGIVIAARD